MASGDIRDIFYCHTGLGDAIGIEWVEARDAANILQCTKQPPTTKNYLAQNINSAAIVKP